MAVRCLRPYKGTWAFRPIQYAAGDVISDPDQASWLMRDCPEAFALVGEPPVVETKAIEAAPADKMMRPAARKGGKR